MVNCLLIKSFSSAHFGCCSALAQSGGSGVAQDKLTVRDVAALMRAPWAPQAGYVLGGQGPVAAPGDLEGGGAQEEGAGRRTPRPRAQRAPRVRLDPALAALAEEGMDGGSQALGRGQRRRSRQQHQEQQQEEEGLEPEQEHLIGQASHGMDGEDGGGGRGGVI